MGVSKVKKALTAIKQLFCHPHDAMVALYVQSQVQIDGNEILRLYNHGIDGVKLNDIGRKRSTDKADIVVSNGKWKGAGHDYLRRYELLLSPMQNAEMDVVEFGCGDGGSLKMWKEYFTNARITGIDLNPKAKSFEEERISVYIGDVTEEQTFADVTNRNTNIMLFVDDASHACGDQRRTLELFWPALQSGGWYIAEDLECGCLGVYPAYPPKIIDSQPFFSYMKDRISILRWSKNCGPRENREHYAELPQHIQQLESSIDMAVFIPGAIALKKA